MPIISAILGIVNSVISGVSQEQRDKLALALQTNQIIADADANQTKVNALEASNPNIFVSGWRPAIGWICAASFAWQFVVMPILLFATATFHFQVTVPTFDMATMSTILMGMLGLGGLRTYEKIQGVARR